MTISKEELTSSSKGNERIELLQAAHQHGISLYSTNFLPTSLPIMNIFFCRQKIRCLLLVLALIGMNCLQAKVFFSPSQGSTQQTPGITVTTADYILFLNAVARDDESRCYDTVMQKHSCGASIIRQGELGNYTYACLAGGEEKPVAFVDEEVAKHYYSWLEDHGKNVEGYLLTERKDDETLDDLRSSVSELRLIMSEEGSSLSLAKGDSAPGQSVVSSAFVKGVSCFAIGALVATMVGGSEAQELKKRTDENNNGESTPPEDHFVGRTTSESSYISVDASVASSDDAARPKKTRAEEWFQKMEAEQAAIRKLEAEARKAEFDDIFDRSKKPPYKPLTMVEIAKRDLTMNQLLKAEVAAKRDVEKFALAFNEKWSKVQKDTILKAIFFGVAEPNSLSEFEHSNNFSEFDALSSELTRCIINSRSYYTSTYLSRITPEKYAAFLKRNIPSDQSSDTATRSRYDSSDSIRSTSSSDFKKETPLEPDYQKALDELEAAYNRKRQCGQAYLRADQDYASLTTAQKARLHSATKDVILERKEAAYSKFKEANVNINACQDRVRELYAQFYSRSNGPKRRSLEEDLKDRSTIIDLTKRRSGESDRVVLQRIQAKYGARVNAPDRDEGKMKEWNNNLIAWDDAINEMTDFRAARAALEQQKADFQELLKAEQVPDKQHYYNKRIRIADDELNSCNANLNSTRKKLSDLTDQPGSTVLYQHFLRQEREDAVNLATAELAQIELMLEKKQQKWINQAQRYALALINNEENQEHIDADARKRSLESIHLSLISLAMKIFEYQRVIGHPETGELHYYDVDYRSPFRCQVKYASPDEPRKMTFPVEKELLDRFSNEEKSEILDIAGVADWKPTQQEIDDFKEQGQAALNSAVRAYQKFHPSEKLLLHPSRKSDQEILQRVLEKYGPEVLPPDDVSPEEKKEWTQNILDWVDGRNRRNALCSEGNEAKKDELDREREELLWLTTEPGSRVIYQKLQQQAYEDAINKATEANLSTIEGSIVSSKQSRASALARYGEYLFHRPYTDASEPYDRLLESHHHLLEEVIKYIEYRRIQQNPKEAETLYRYDIDYFSPWRCRLIYNPSVQERFFSFRPDKSLWSKFTPQEQDEILRIAGLSSREITRQEIDGAKRAAQQKAQREYY